MNKEKELFELISLIKCCFRQEKFPNCLREDVDYDSLFELAKNNSVANTIASVLGKVPGIPEKVSKSFERQQALAMAQNMFRDKALSEVFSSLEKQKVNVLVLKGTVLKSIYPTPYARSMSDIDIFAESASMEVIHSAMMSLGYQTGMFDKWNHYSYKLGDMVELEFHPELVDLEGEYGKKVFRKLHPQAENIVSHLELWNHVMPFEKYEYVHQLVPEYHYAYVIMHMMKHFLSNGTGIRSVMDVWIMNRHYAATWNRKQIEVLLTDLGLATFEKYALALADKWFGLENLTYLPRDVDEAVLKQYEEYILESGTYGNLANMINSELKDKKGPFYKLRYAAGKIFLPYDIMQQVYPVLRKAPFLYPFAWIYRLVVMNSSKRTHAQRQLKGIFNADREKANKHKELMETMTR